jgi:hypothetical protein
VSFYLRSKHLHDRIISIRGEACEHKTSFTSSISIEVNWPPQESKQSCRCVYNLPLFLRFLSFYHPCIMDNSHISDKILILKKLKKNYWIGFPFMWAKVPSLITTKDFHFAIDYLLIDLENKIKLIKLHSKYLSFTVCLHWKGNTLPSMREITHMKQI